MDWLELIIVTINTLFQILKSSTLAASRLALYLIRLTAYPIASTWGTLLFVFSPVTHTVRFVLSPILWLLNSFPRLQPLYIYFGSAAFIGLIVGLLFKLTSASMLTILNLYDDPNDEAVSGPTKQKHLYSPVQPLSSSQNNNTFVSSSSGKRTAVDDGYGNNGYDYESRPTTPNSQFRSEQRELELLLANLSSPDSDQRGGRDAALAALTGSLSGSSSGVGGWRDSPNTKRKRRSVGIGGGGHLGLGGGSSSSRFHTILEEDDDSL